jgi:hypothetical protein
MRSIMNPFHRSQRARRPSESSFRARRRANALRPHALECLEGRDLPAILFTPLTPQKAVDGGGLKLPDPEVHLIFWGSVWDAPGGLSTATIIGAANNVLKGTFQGVQIGPYLRDLGQYDSRLGQAHLGQTVIDTSPIPAAGIKESDITTVVERAIDTGTLPDTHHTDNGNQAIYVVITPPSVVDAEKSFDAGFHNFEFRDFFTSRVNYAWVGTRASGLSTLDAFTTIFGHEIAESISNPNADPFGLSTGITLSPGFSPPNDSEICDGEAQHYTARINGNLVQSYWSQQDHAYSIPFGGTQTFRVTNRVLTVSGDQRSSPDDIITVAAKGSNEVVTLNGEQIVLPLSELDRVVVKSGSGTDSIKILSTSDLRSVPVSVAPGTGNDTIDVEAVEIISPVDIKLGGGTDTVNLSPTLRNIDTIEGKVSVTGGSGFDSLNLFDQDRPSSQAYSVDNTGVFWQAGGSVVYSLINVLTVNGPRRDALYNVLNTSVLTTRINTNSNNTSSDTVNVFGTTGPLEIANFGAGTNHTVQIGAPGKGVGDVNGRVSVANTPNRTHLIVDDSPRNVDHTNVVLDAGRISNLAAGEIDYVTNDVNAVDIKTGLGMDTFNVIGTPPDNTANALTTLDPGGGANFIYVKATAPSGPLKIVDGPFDVVQVGDQGKTGNVRGDLILSSPPAATALFVDDSQDTGGRNVALAPGKITGLLGGQAVISFDPAALANLNVKTGSGADAYTVTGTLGGATQLTTITTGSGVDTVDVKATTGPLTIVGGSTLVAGSHDRVTIGDAGTLAKIKGNVLVKNPPSFTDLIIDGSADAAQLTAKLAISADGLTGKVIGLSQGEIDYNPVDLASLRVKAGQAGGTITVATTGAPTSPAIVRPTTIDLGGGTYTVNVLATGANSPLTVNAGPGLDTVRLGSAANTLDGIQGAVVLNGRGAFQTPTGPPPARLLFLEDAAAPLSTTYTVTGATSPAGIQGATVTRPGAAPMTVFNGSLNIDYPRPPAAASPIIGSGSSLGGPVFNVKGIGAGTAVTLHGDGAHATVNVGNDAGSLEEIQGPLILTGANGSAVLNVNDQGAAAGQVYTFAGSTLTRSGAAPMRAWIPVSLALNGGRGGNRFDVESLAAGITASVNAGPGGDLVRMRGGPVAGALTVNGRGNTRLGYAAYTKGVYVNLRDGAATDLAGFRGIRQVTGGQGADVLIGDDKGAILVGGPGDDLLVGGEGRDVLIGGEGRDALIGGGGDDILIGGRTAYDLDPAALAAVLAEWSRTDLGYTGRVDHLLHGGGLAPKLDATTVFDDGAADVLAGGERLDLFLADAHDVLPDKQKKEVRVTIGGG